MNIEQIRDEIAELEKRVCELKKELEEMLWKPEKDEAYWIVNEGGDVSKSYFEGDEFDIHRIEWGNCYSQREKAEFEANREKYTRLFRQYVEQHSEPLDWLDDTQEKYSVSYEYKNEKLGFGYSLICKDAFIIYASSEEVLQEAIDFVGEDNFKKYILEIKE